jgi:uncharacterized protein YjbI with pentapeptide repeats
VVFLWGQEHWEYSIEADVCCGKNGGVWAGGQKETRAMANPEHLQILQQGVEAWNQWRSHTNIRPDLRRANLRRADLRGADLRGADLSEAIFYRTNLTGAHLSRADLTGADLTRAFLTEANLSGADLTGATLTMAYLETVFGDTNLTAVQGLETCYHSGPSTLDLRTLAKSGPLPWDVLWRCGLNDWQIEATKLYQPDLTPAQINDIVYRIYNLRAEPLIQFYSCFISYASKDNAFAEQLYADLQKKGVRCWFAPEDMKIGDRLRLRIDETIGLYDKLLLILSKTSVASQWVEEEVETALVRERKQGTTVLFPVQIDNTVMNIKAGWPAFIRNTRNIGDFRRWKTHEVYQQAFARLLCDLTAEAKQPGAESRSLESQGPEDDVRRP